MRQPIGILGGTFDPVHLGHLRIARIAYKRLRLQRVFLVLAGLPKHRILRPLASIDDRLALLRLAVSGSRLLKLDDRKVSRLHPSYTINTLRSYRREYPHAPLCFILGWDSFVTLRAWYKWRELIRLAHFVVINRGKKKEKYPWGLRQFIRSHKTEQIKDLYRYLSGKIYFLSIAPINISATDIRARCKSGKSIARLVPKPVAAYIHQHLLYEDIDGKHS